MVVPDSDPRADIRDDTEQEQTRGAVASSLPKTTVASPVNRSSDLAKIGLAFAKYLTSLPQAQYYASEACKAVDNSLPKARDILNRHGKLKGLVSQCPYLSLQGGPHGGTYLLVLNVKQFRELNRSLPKKGWTREGTFVVFVCYKFSNFLPKKGWTVVGQFMLSYMN